MTEHGGEGIRIVSVRAESVVVRDRFRLGVDHEFIGIAAARLAIQRRSPLAKNAFQFFLRYGRDLLDGFNAEGAKRAFGDFADTRNLSHRQRREKPLFAAPRHPDEPPRLGLVERNLRKQPRPSVSARTPKLRPART